jgi:hypothetical protein
MPHPSAPVIESNTLGRVDVGRWADIDHWSLTGHPVSG